LRYASTSEGESLFEYDKQGAPLGWDPSDDLSELDETAR
jgi:hypothetical protein